jgi:SAM-dependent methyltransferase
VTSARALSGTCTERALNGPSGHTLGARYFEAMYAQSADPWEFEGRWYEKRKYALSIAMLPERRYGDAFEAGCSVGGFTAMLARRCDRLLACDLAEAAVQTTAGRTRDLPSVTVERRVIPAEWPPGTFDLIVLSEVLYYFGDQDLDEVIGCTVEALQPGGAVLAVHWRHPVDEYPQTGDAVHRALAAHPGLAEFASQRELDFLAEVRIRTDCAPASVAQATGLA